MEHMGCEHETLSSGILLSHPVSQGMLGYHQMWHESGTSLSELSEFSTLFTCCMSHDEGNYGIYASMNVVIVNMQRSSKFSQKRTFSIVFAGGN